MGPALEKYMKKKKQKPYTSSGAGHEKPMTRMMDKKGVCK